MKLHELERWYGVAESQHCGVITDPTRPDNPIRHVTNAFLTVTDYTRDEVIGRNCRFLQAPETDPATVARIRQALVAVTPITVTILNQTKHGVRFWNQLSIRPSLNAVGELDAFIAIQCPFRSEASGSA